MNLTPHKGVLILLCLHVSRWKLNWDYLIQNFGESYAEDLGRPSIPIRVVAGLHYIKYLENESDESVVEKF